MIKPIRTPCVGICSTGIGDAVCRGCKRFAHEVIDWNAYTHSQRATIARRLEGFLTQVVQTRLEIVDETRLLAQIEHQQIRFDRSRNPYCWVFDLLRAGASQIADLDAYGLRLQPASRNIGLVRIKEMIDADYYTLSCAHYDRYIAPGEIRQVCL
ncbi:DUF1289 domain-containing protein [Exilibacterium tricleocarpae]|uniref:DUF1289 domain-containing protein n=1 Tax=Exilibacterium tricleocarpae TaxID=2591008 RepID=A0A545TLL3_9GAMM|nr:DUF1289 domain-containing protein [Exilibacterium tricleocarpae]TQV78125.1 DUF1289 domain-containing protein [Exilibacterium tricleocarpae]